VPPFELALALPREDAGDPAEVRVESLEERLVGRARRGDAGAFRAIHERHSPAVGRFLRDLFGDAAAAEEGLQETFVRAFVRLDSLRDGEKLLAWLLGIARRVWLESRRAQRRRAEDDPPEPEGEAFATDPAHSPESLFLSREARAHLDRALSAISPDRRTVILLRSDHGLSCAEAAEVLGWSVAKVKVELFRARAQLRTLLAAHYGETP
jgi:RNA polymerase sigma-70 factor (ECF subfamily)